MKLSVSLTDEDVQALDAYVSKAGLGSRSAALQHAVRLLKHASLDADYASAWGEWDTSPEAPVWEPATTDGVGHAAR